MPSLRSLTLASLAATGTLVAARPSWNGQPTGNRWSHNGQGNDGHPGQWGPPTGSQPDACMTDTDAQGIVDVWNTLITAYSDAVADANLTPNFTDYSESVNTLINTCPQGDAAKPLDLLAPTFTTRDAFELGQGQQPAINFQQLNIWHSCNSVSARWETTNTAPIPDPKPVVGIFTLEVVPSTDGSGKWLIDTAYSEFDSGAWLQNLQKAGICAGSTDPINDPTASSTTTVVGAAVSTTATLVSPAVAGSTYVSVADAGVGAMSAAPSASAVL